MPGPGADLADVTEGITRVETLPKARAILRSHNDNPRKCPRGGRGAYRLRGVERLRHDVGDLVSARPHESHLTSSQPHCSHGGQYFNAALSDVAPPGSQYTHRGVAVAVRLVVEDGLPYRAASWPRWRDHRGVVPVATSQHGVEASGKKSARASGLGRPRLGPG